MARVLKKNKTSQQPLQTKDKLVVYQSEKKQSHLTKKEKTVKNFLDSLQEQGKHVNHAEVFNTFLKKGYVSEDELAAAFAEKYNIEHINNLKDYKISQEVINLVPFKLCQRYSLIPLVKVDKTLVVVFSDPSDIHIRDNIAVITNCRIEPVVASQSAIRAALNKYYDNQSEWNNLFYKVDKGTDIEEDSLNTENIVDLEAALVGDKSKQEEMAVIQLVNLIFSEAVRLKSSDIHIEVYEKVFRIRYRVDGVLHEKHNLPKSTAAAIISRIKVISHMDISERRRPQDARLKVKLGVQELNVRVSCIPSINGEKIVMRLLDASALQVDISALGMDEEHRQMFQTALHRPQGLILMTGPTGSGKTTTIYSGLISLNTPNINISTVEDPVEFRIHGINQVQVNPKVQLNFASALRSFLRQDPDVILVGEIRDKETSDVVFKAAATGHLVLSTLHTNDTASTVSRLLNMGVPSYTLADNISLIVSQRLLRKICSRCSVLVEDIPDNLLVDIGVPERETLDYKGKIYKKGNGCSHCNEMGYIGRIAVYEMMRITPSIKAEIFKNASAKEIKQSAIEDGMKTLRQSALQKLKIGLTSIEEVIRMTVPD